MIRLFSIGGANKQISIKNFISIFFVCVSVVTWVGAISRRNWGCIPRFWDWVITQKLPSPRHILQRIFK